MIVELDRVRIEDGISRGRGRGRQEDGNGQ
jgi:hypothetical protein